MKISLSPHSFLLLLKPLFIFAEILSLPHKVLMKHICMIKSMITAVNGPRKMSMDKSDERNKPWHNGFMAATNISWAFKYQ